MEFEIVLIVIFAIIAGTTIITTIAKSIVGAVKHKSEVERMPVGSSLTTSELEQMLRDVVGEATAPLYTRMEALEERLAHPMLEARHPEIELPDTPQAEAAPATRNRQQT